MDPKVKLTDSISLSHSLNHQSHYADPRRDNVGGPVVSLETVGVLPEVGTRVGCNVVGSALDGCSVVGCSVVGATVSRMITVGIGVGGAVTGERVGARVIISSIVGASVGASDVGS
jgi:hypothetical protein